MTVKLLISIEELNNLKSRDQVPLQCYQCLQTFFTTKNEVQKVLAGHKGQTKQFCSHSCRQTFKGPPVEVVCRYCHKHFQKSASQVRKSLNHFCSRSCNTKYGNSNKQYGVHESKAELFLRRLILQHFTSIHMVCNTRAVLPSGLELDIYLPNQQTAIEINGPTHYFPIFGEQKHQIIKVKDQIKNAECISLGINLITIDISRDKTKASYEFTIYSIFKERILPLVELGWLKELESSND